VKLSGRHNSLVLAGLLLGSAAGVVQAQDTRDARTDLSTVMATAAAEGEADETLPVVQVLHLEAPIALSRLNEQEEAALISAFMQPAPVPDVTNAPPVFAELSPQQQAYLQRMQDIGSYEQALEELEYEGGAWSQEVAQELETLGALLQQQGQYEQAIKVFDRAVHINRVNHGLFSPQQVPLVERVVDGHVALGQWQDADAQQQYAFYVQTKAYGVNDPRMIAVFEDMARWNVTSFYRGIDPDPTLRLMQTFLLYRAAADTVMAHFGPRDPRYLPLLRNVANASDMMTRYALPGTSAGTEANPNMRMVSEFAGRSTRPQGGGSGEAALARIVDFYADERRPDTPETRMMLARARAELGDWYLLRDRRQAAMRVYQEAWDELTAVPEGSELAQQVFGDIVFLPAFSTFDAEKKEALGLNADSGARIGHVDVAFDVSKYGRMTNFEILAQEPADLRRVDLQIISALRGMMARPRLEEGRTVESLDERYRIHFWY
jgi:tetratricopeptide (TPR) repeat protein